MLITTNSGLELFLRAPEPDDDPYVLSTMVRTVLGINGDPPPSYRNLPDRQANAVERELRRRWVDDDFIKAVAVLPDDDWLIVGYVIGRPRVLTYLSVRAGFTGQGVATALLRLLGIDKDTPSAVEFPTWDLERWQAGRDFPIGIMHSGHWPLLQLVPWTPPQR